MAVTMTGLAPRPPIPEFDWRYVVVEAGDYVVVVDVAKATRTVVWVDNWAWSEVTRYRSPGRIAWFTVVPAPVGMVIQLETDGADPTFTVLLEAAADGVDLPLIAVGTARRA